MNKIPWAMALVLSIFWSTTGCIKKKAPYLTSEAGRRYEYDDISRAAIALRDELSVLIHIAIATQKSEQFRTRGPYVVFAPSNSAFGDLPSKEMTRDWSRRHFTNWTRLFDHLYAVGVAPDPEFRHPWNFRLADGTEARLERREGRLLINDIPIRKTVTAGNGVVHVIDKIPYPPGLEKMLREGTP